MKKGARLLNEIRYNFNKDWPDVLLIMLMSYYIWPDPSCIMLSFSSFPYFSYRPSTLPFLLFFFIFFFSSFHSPFHANMFSSFFLFYFSILISSLWRNEDWIVPLNWVLDMPTIWMEVGQPDIYPNRWL